MAFGRYDVSTSQEHQSRRLPDLKSHAQRCEQHAICICSYEAAAIADFADAVPVAACRR